MAWAPAALMAVSGGMQAYGQYQSGKAADRAGKAQQAAAYAEAGMLDQRAGQERAIGQRQAEDVRKQGALIAARQRALQASSGFASDDVGAVAITKATAREVSMQELLALAQSEDEARMTEFQANMRRRGGDFARYEGKVARRAGALSAATTLLQTGASAWGMRPKPKGQ